MNLPKFLQPSLYSYDLKSLNPKRDARLIVTQILNYGNWRQVQWLKDFYGFEKIKEVLRNPNRGMWFPDVLNYWQTILNIKIAKRKMNKAVFSLTPKR